MANENRWQDLHEHLVNNGFDTYAPSTKIGECKAPYLVLRSDGSNRHPSGISTDVDLYTIMCYVPREQYSSLETIVQLVKVAMADLRPMFLPAGIQTPSFYDDQVKAHMVSITYKNYKKMV